MSSRYRGILTGRAFVFTEANDNVLGILRLTSEVVLEDTPHTFGVACLCVKSCTRVVWHHPVAPAKRVLCGSQNMVFGSRLDIPDITSITYIASQTWTPAATLHLPFRWPDLRAATTSSLLQIAPRAVLTRYAPFLKCLRRSALIRPRVPS